MAWGFQGRSRGHGTWGPSVISAPRPGVLHQAVKGRQSLRFAGEQRKRKRGAQSVVTKPWTGLQGSKRGGRRLRPPAASTAALSSGLCSMSHPWATVPHSGQGTETLPSRRGFLHTSQTPEISRSVFVLERYMIPLRITKVPILQRTRRSLRLQCSLRGAAARAPSPLHGPTPPKEGGHEQGLSHSRSRRSRSLCPNFRSLHRRLRPSPTPQGHSSLTWGARPS